MEANMTRNYNTPQDAEDAYYDALEEADLERLLSIWADTDDICCMLPMYPMVQGHAEVKDVFTHLLERGGVALAVNHLSWIETDDIAIHQVQETIQDTPAGTPQALPFYGTNIYRKDSSGWRLIVHQNAPAPPPPELVISD
ncbi:MAG: nuclear transport factor 2 family protein [Gammaproteobacteria bacterium]